MEIDVKIGSKTLPVEIENPYKFDLAQVTENIIDFGMKSGADLTALEIDKLIPRMIRGVAGCEGGCPSDAQHLVRQGFGSFKLSYIEGGILTALFNLDNDTPLEIKIFPDFD